LTLVGHVELIEVGEGRSDHRCWQRAEDMTTPRTAYRLDASHAGSDVAAETAAAMAAASLAFRPQDDAYADTLVAHAREVPRKISTSESSRGR
jgi:hypothetical protein